MTSSALVRRVLAPDGSVLTLADLPPPDAQRWVASRKAIVVAAVRGGLLSMSDACARYRLTTEEFLNWQMQVDRNGLKGCVSPAFKSIAEVVDARTYTMSASPVLASKEASFSNPELRGRVVERACASPNSPEAGE